eukprot:c40171_g1_i1 orf=26-238(+)
MKPLNLINANGRLQHGSISIKMNTQKNFNSLILVQRKRYGLFTYFRHVPKKSTAQITSTMDSPQCISLHY